VLARLILVLAVVASTLGASPAGAQTAAAPVVEGPIPADAVGSGSRDYPFGSSVQDLAAAGYVEREYFYSGDTPAGAYKTRMLVRRPADPAKFSGTVIVEWTNVTNLWDLDAYWVRSAEHVMRSGDVFVAIDAQAAGVVSPETGLKAWSPKRYGSLEMPQTLSAAYGDGGMFDIFGQGLQAIRNPGGVDPLDGLETKTLLVTGVSQSALYLYFFAQTHDPQYPVADGFLITEASTSTLGQNGQTSVALPVGPTRVPVLWLNSETDSSHRRQPDSSWFRYWEVAGTTHVDRDARDIMDVIVKRDLGKPIKPLDCGHPPYSRIHFKHAQHAATEELERWIATGKPPRSRTDFAYDENGIIVRDAFENALGGVRLPEMDVPTANNSRENTGVCAGLYGRSVPFSEERLRLLYPTHADYVKRLQDATFAAVKAGDVLPADAAATMALATAPASAAVPCRPRVVTLRFPRSVRGRRVLRTRVTAGARQPVRVRSRRLSLSLAGLRGTVPVRVDQRLRGGRLHTVVRRFRACA
jgi:hypothetical protein